MNPSSQSESAQTPVSVPSDIPSSYSPSVPMSVYRELAAELQATKAMADSLNGQNQHLTRQNQLLRQEIYRVVQTTLQLGQFAGVAQPAEVEVSMPTPLEKPFEKPTTGGQSKLRPETVARRAPKPINKLDKPAPAEQANSRGSLPKALAIVPKFFTEPSGEKQPYELDPDKAKDISGLWLVVSVILIILTAFGAGFLIMRPILRR